MLYSIDKNFYFCMLINSIYFDTMSICKIKNIKHSNKPL